LALWLFGFVMKVVLSLLVNETVGSWVGGAFGFLALVFLGLLGWNGSRAAREQEVARHPES
jgi:hypothetical protein